MEPIIRPREEIFRNSYVSLKNHYYVYSFEQMCGNKDDLCVKAVSLNYRRPVKKKLNINFAIPIVISMKQFSAFNNFLKTFDVIAEIDYFTITNYRMYACNTFFFDVLLDNSSDIFLDGVLCVINFHQKRSAWRKCNYVYNILKNNATTNKNLYAIAPSLKILDNIAIEIFLMNTTREISGCVDYVSALDGLPRIVYMYNPLLNHNVPMDHPKKRIIDYDISKYFKPVGVYYITSSMIELKNLNINVNTIFPIMAMDIETIARNLKVVPTGITQYEKISSLVITVKYCGITLMYVLYLRNNGKQQTHRSDAAYFEDYMMKRYNQSSEHILILGFDTEAKLIEHFFWLYAGGNILKELTSNGMYPHILLGHNIIDYDINVIVNRCIVLKLVKLLAKYFIVEDYPNKKNAVVKFHPNAIIMDTYHIVKNNSIHNKYRLKDLSSEFLKEQGKIDLDPVLIRRFYLLGYANSCKFITDIYRSKSELNRKKRFDYNSIKHQIITINRDEFNEIPFDTNAVKCEKKKKLLWSLINPSNDDIIKIPSLEYILIYNIMDCLSLLKLESVLHLLEMAVSFANRFNIPLEKALVVGNSNRLPGFLNETFFKMGYFFSYARDEDIYIYKTDIQDIMSLKAIDTDYLTKSCIQRNKLICTVNSKKGFTGALNMAEDSRRIFMNLISFDFNSFYPNQICSKNLSMSSVEVITVYILQHIMQTNPYLSATVLQKYMQNKLIKIFLFDDPQIETRKLFSINYDGQQIGHYIHSLDEIMDLDKNTKLLILFNNPSNHFAKLIEDLLLARKECKIQLEIAKKKGDIINEALYKSLQQVYKIIVNSLYGLMGASHSKLIAKAVCAAITTFGRKDLVIAARAIICFYYEEAMSYFNTIDISNLNGQSINVKAIKQCLLNLRNESKCKTFLLSKGLGQNEYNRFSNDIIIYVDTDGIKFTNHLNLPTTNIQSVLKKTNNLFLEIYGSKYINMEMEKQHTAILVLKKKKYIYIDVAIEFANKDIELAYFKNVNGIDMDILAIECVGFERNGNSRLKDIISYTVRLVYVLVKSNTKVEIMPYFFSIFDYLQNLDQNELIVYIRLNYQQNQNTAMAKYITNNTTDYSGEKLATMRTDFSSDHSIITNNLNTDHFMTHTDWKNNRCFLNYYKFLTSQIATLEQIFTYCYGYIWYTKCLNTNVEGRNFTDCNRFNPCHYCKTYKNVLGGPVKREKLFNSILYFTYIKWCKKNRMPHDNRYANVEVPDSSEFNNFVSEIENGNKEIFYHNTIKNTKVLYDIANNSLPSNMHLMLQPN